MTQTKLSIITPVFNTGEYLRETLDSVFNQVISDFEFIAIDDGSTDDSLEILTSYAENHSNMVVRSFSNSGETGRPRNSALDIATGEYLFFLDSDDILTPDAMQNAVNLADSTGSDIVPIMLDSFGVGKMGVPRAVFEKKPYQSDFVECLAYRTLGPWKLFRHDLIKRYNIRFGEGYPSGGDMPFVLHAYLKSNHVSALADKVYYWLRSRERADSPATGGNMRRYKVNTFQIWSKVRAPVCIIDSQMDPGARRELLMTRHFLNGHDGLPRVFNKNFLSLNEEDQRSLLIDVNSFAHLWTEGLKSQARESTRILLNAVFLGDLKQLINEIREQNSLPVYDGSKKLFNGDDELFKEEASLTNSYAEYGSGESTIWVGKNTSAEIHSVDTSRDWIFYVEGEVGKDRALLEYIDCGQLKNWGYPKNYEKRHNFCSYAESIWKRDSSPELVLVDGRFRVFCFLTSIIYASSGTKIIFDDYVHRPHYHVVEELIKPTRICGRQALFTVPSKNEIDFDLAKFLADKFQHVLS